ncbi:hypothetical protein BST61_g8539 [Cercospora zeina]
MRTTWPGAVIVIGCVHFSSRLQCACCAAATAGVSLGMRNVDDLESPFPAVFLLPHRQSTTPSPQHSQSHDQATKLATTTLP